MKKKNREYGSERTRQESTERNEWSGVWITEESKRLGLKLCLNFVTGNLEFCDR